MVVSLTLKERHYDVIYIFFLYVNYIYIYIYIYIVSYTIQVDLAYKSTSKL